MTRDKLPPLASGWDVDPLTLDEPEPEKPRRHRMDSRHKLINRDGWVVCSAADCSYMRPASPRRFGCSIFIALLVIVLLSSWIPGQAVAGEPEPTGAVSEHPTIMQIGTLSYVSPRYGPEYLALPFPRGTVAEICGPADCVTRRSTDYGPDQRVHPDRIADLSAADFVFVCGVPLSAGLCRGTVEIEPPVSPDDDRMRAEDGPQVTTPPTDTAP